MDTNGEKTLKGEGYAEEKDIYGERKHIRRVETYTGEGVTWEKDVES